MKKIWYYSIFMFPLINTQCWRGQQDLWTLHVGNSDVFKSHFGFSKTLSGFSRIHSHQFLKLPDYPAVYFHETCGSYWLFLRCHVVRWWYGATWGNRARYYTRWKRVWTESWDRSFWDSVWAPPQAITFSLINVAYSFSIFQLCCEKAGFESGFASDFCCEKTKIRREHVSLFISVARKQIFGGGASDFCCEKANIRREDVFFQGFVSFLQGVERKCFGKTLSACVFQSQLSLHLPGIYIYIYCSIYFLLRFSIAELFICLVNIDWSSNYMIYFFYFFHDYNNIFCVFIYLFIIG